MLKLKKYVREESNGSIEVLSTVAQLIGVGGKIDVIKSNIRNTKKNIALVLKDSKGNSTVLPTSKQVNAMLRGGQLAVSDLKAYPIYETKRMEENEETGVEEEIVSYVIGMPQSDDAGTETVATITKADLGATAEAVEFDYEEYIRF
jgi:hypothetical protein